MSLKTSASMPVENYSVIQQSENGTQFGPNNKIRFRVGSHLGYVDFHTSYLQFNLEVKNAVAKMEFSNEMGADILIRTWRLLIGGHIVEEIDHPNVLLKVMKYDYGQDLGMAEVCEVLDKSGRATGYQGLNKIEAQSAQSTIDIGAGDNPCALVKCILDLNFSGIFGSTQTFPVGMTGDVEIEITLEDPRKCLQVVQSGRFAEVSSYVNDVPIRGVPLADIDLPVFGTDPAAAFVGLDMELGASIDQPVFPKLASVANTYTNDQPFTIGQKLNISGLNTANSDDAFTGVATYTPAGGLDALAVVTAIGPGTTGVKISAPNAFLTAVNRQNETDKLQARLRFSPNGCNLANKTWDNAGSLTYEVSVPSLVLQIVVPPQQYVQEQARKVATEGFSIDVPTYTCYKSNTYANVKSATLEIPCYSSRARSILAIGVDGSQALGGNNVLNAPYEYNGLYDDLDNYQFQIGEDRQPVRPVNCGALSTFQHNVAQEQLTELEKALRSAGCNVRSLRKHRNNFVIGRALSAYGGSIPLTMKGARIYLDYLSQDKRLQQDVGVKSKQWFSYVAHIRRLNITPQGVQVMY